MRMAASPLTEFLAPRADAAKRATNFQQQLVNNMGRSAAKNSQYAGTPTAPRTRELILSGRPGVALVGPSLCNTFRREFIWKEITQTIKGPFRTKLFGMAK